MNLVRKRRWSNSNNNKFPSLSLLLGASILAFLLLSGTVVVAETAETHPLAPFPIILKQSNTTVGNRGIDLADAAPTVAVFDNSRDEKEEEDEAENSARRILQDTITPQFCNTKYLLSDMDKNDLFTDVEYARFATWFADGAYDRDTALTKLPAAVQQLFKTFADPVKGTIDIFGGKAVHAATATAQQKASALDLCRQTAAAMTGKPTTTTATGSPPVAAPASTPAAPGAPATVANVNKPAGQAFTVPYAKCKIFLASSDTSRDSFLDQAEYYLFVKRLAGDQWDASARSFADLSPAVQTAFTDLADEDGDGTKISIQGGKPSQTATPAQQTSLEHICTATQDAMNAGSSDSNVNNTPTAATKAPTASTTTTTRATKAPAAGQTYSATFAQCKIGFALSNKVSDAFLDQDEYFLFVKRLAGGQFGSATTFAELPPALQAMYTDLAKNNGDGTKISIEGGMRGQTATPAQQTSLERVCTATQQAMNAGASPDGGTPAATTTKAPTAAGAVVPTKVPSGQTYSVTFGVCKTKILVSNKVQDSFLDQDEYFSFVNRLAGGQFGSATSFTDLPPAVQSMYTGLAKSDGDGTKISIEGGLRGQKPTPAQQTSLEHICTATQEAMNASVDGGSSPVASAPPASAPVTAPTPSGGGSDVEVNLDKCKMAMVVGDSSHDSHLDQEEFVRFVSRLDKSIALNSKFADLPQALQDAFTTLAGAANYIDVTGARPSTTVDATQAAFLERVCTTTVQAINGGGTNNPPATAPTTASPVTQPTSGTTSPAAPPVASTPGSIPVYNAFVLIVINSTTPGAASLLSGPYRRALNKAYEFFVERVVREFQRGLVTTTRSGEIPSSLVDAPAHKPNMFLRGHARRRLKITGLVNGSITIFDLKDSTCPEGVTDPGVCVSVYASFKVTSEGDVYSESVLTNYSQNAVVKNNLLNSLLVKADPTGTIRVVNTTDIHRLERPATLPPISEVNESVEKPQDSDKGGFIAMLIVIVVVGTVGGVYYQYRKNIHNFRGTKASGAASGKTEAENGSDEDDAEATPTAKDAFGFDEENSDAESEAGGKNLFASPENSEVDEDEEEAGGYRVQQQSPERSRVRHGLAAGLTSGLTRGTGIVTTGLSKGTGTVLTTFNTLTGGVAGNLAHGVQRGVQTVGGEVLKGAKTVGQTVQTVGQKTLDTGVMAGGIVGNVGLGLVGTATGGLIGGKKRGGATEGEEEEVVGSNVPKEVDENLEDFANYAFDDPEEMHGDADLLATHKSGKGGNSGSSWEEKSDRSTGFFESNDDDDDSYSESGSGITKSTAGDKGSRTAASILPEGMRHLDAMVDKGDWDGVMKAATKYDVRFDNLSTASSKDGSKASNLQDFSETDSSSEGTNDSENLDDEDDRISLTSDDLRRRELYGRQVEALVKQYVPEEIGNVSTMLDQFAGREDELIKTLQTMSERGKMQRARRIVHKSKAIPERENRAFDAGATGSAAIAAASTLGGGLFGNQGAQYDDDEEYSSSNSGSESGSYTGSGEGSHSDEGSRSGDDKEDDDYSHSESDSRTVSDDDDDDDSYDDAGDDGEGFDGAEFDDGGSYRSGAPNLDEGRAATRKEEHSDSGSYDDEPSGTGTYDEPSGTGTYEGEPSASFDSESQLSRSRRSKDKASVSSRHSISLDEDDDGPDDDDDRSGSYDDDRSGSYDEERGDDRSRSYDDEDRSRSYDDDDDDRSRGYDDEDRSRSYDDDDDRSRSYDDEDRSRSYDDDDDRSRSIHDDDDRSRSIHDDDRSRSIGDDDDRSRSIGDDDDRSRSYDDEDRSRSYDDEDRSRSYDDDDDQSGSYDDDDRRSSRPDDRRSSRPDDRRASRHDDDVVDDDLDEDISGSYSDEGSYVDDRKVVDDPKRSIRGGRGDGGDHDDDPDFDDDERSYDDDDDRSYDDDERSYDDDDDEGSFED